MQAVIRAVETEQWNGPEVLPYKTMHDELSVYNGLVFTGNWIVILASLRGKAVDLAHQGTVETKQLIRDKVWFPGIEMTEQN